MSAPELGPALDFLEAIGDLADAYAAEAPERVTSIGAGAGILALAKRLIVKREPDSCIYLHRWLRDDPDDLHDHPWDWCSIILTVGYWEISEAGPFAAPSRMWRPPGSVLFRRAEEKHRVEREDDFLEAPVSLFITSVERRRWGFWTKTGFVDAAYYRSEADYAAQRETAR